MCVLQGKGFASAADIQDEDDWIPAGEEQPGPSGAAPSGAIPGGQNADEHVRSQNMRASAVDKVSCVFFF